MGQNESLPAELRTLDFFDSAQRRALFDDDERAALTLMTSAIPNVSNSAPESRRALLATLTSIGVRSGARLAAHPVELHLVTRNFCARMIRNSPRRDAGSTLFPDLLRAAVQQLRVVSGETPRATVSLAQEASLLQRVCNTLALCRVFLVSLLAHQKKTRDGLLLRHILYKPVDERSPAAEAGNGLGAEPKANNDVVSTLLRGLAEFCSTMASSTSTGGMAAASGLSQDSSSSQAPLQIESSLYDVRVEALNLLLVLISSRLFSDQGGNRDEQSAHMFLDTLKKMLSENTHLSSSLVQSLLAQFSNLKAAPSGSSVQLALSEIRAFPSLYSTMTSPPVPEALLSLGRSRNDPATDQAFSEGSGNDGLLGLAWSLGSGLSQGVSSIVGSFIPAGEDNYRESPASKTYRPLADRSMMLLCILAHDCTSASINGGSEYRNGESVNANASFRECLASLEDSEFDGIMSGMAGYHSAAETTFAADAAGGGSSGAIRTPGSGAKKLERMASPQVAFRSLYSAFAQHLDESFIEDRTLESAVATAGEMGHIASVAAGMDNVSGLGVGSGNGSEGENAYGNTKLERLSAAARRRLVGARSSILLYTLLTISPAFRGFVFARDDLDSLVLPLLRSLHGHYFRGGEKSGNVAPQHRPLPPAHLYVVMVLLLMFSQDESFQDGAFTRSVTLSKEDALRGWFAFGSGGMSNAMAGIGENAAGTGSGGQGFLSSLLSSSVASSPQSADTRSAGGGGGAAGALGNVMLVVLIRSMQAEATKFRWSDCKAKMVAASSAAVAVKKGGRSGDNGKDVDDSLESIKSWVPSPSPYQCESLCAVMCNMSSRCVGLHTYAASRLVSLTGLLSRRVRWAGRRAKQIAHHELPVAACNADEMLKGMPMLGSLVVLWSGEAENERVASADLKECGSLSRRLALAELCYLDAQLTASVQLLRAVVEYQCQCLRPKMLRRNLHLLYALVYNSSNSGRVGGRKGSSDGNGRNSTKSDVLGSFRERWFEQDFENQAWAAELCSLADPLVDVVEFLQIVLAENMRHGEDYPGVGVDGGAGRDLEANGQSSEAKVSGNGASSWTSVEAVMEVLEQGARSYRTKRETLRLDEVDDGSGGASEMESAMAAFVYEETEGAAAFFLPYTWSLAVDMTRDLGWPNQDIVLFPSVPYFESWEEEEEEEAEVVVAAGIQQSSDELPPI